MNESFVINAPTCMRHGVPVRNCSCGGHASNAEDKPTPIPILEIDYAELAGLSPLSGESEPEADDLDFGYVEQRVWNEATSTPTECDCKPTSTGNYLCGCKGRSSQPQGAGGFTSNVNDRPTPIPFVEIDYAELAKSIQ